MSAFPDNKSSAEILERQPGSIGVSVIIPARNEEKTLGQCLESLARMNYPAEDFEVIVVDNGSSDRTKQIAQSFSARLNLTVLEADGNISAVRNRGAAAARGRIFAFADADCIVPRNWLSGLGMLLTSPQVGVLGAHGLIPEDSSWVARAWYRDVATNKRGEVSYVPTLDLIVKRPVFFEVRGFDENLETNEDFEFCQRVRRAGFLIMGVPEIAVVHLGTPQTFTSFYTKQRWHGTHVFRVFLRDVRSFYNARAILFAFYTLLSLLACAAGIFQLLTSGHGMLLALSLGALVLAPLLLSCRVCFRRRNWADLLPLVLLNLAYGVGRATCLLEVRKWWGSWRRGHGSASEPASLSAVPAKSPGTSK